MFKGTQSTEAFLLTHYCITLVRMYLNPGYLLKSNSYFPANDNGSNYRKNALSSSRVPPLQEELSSQQFCEPEELRSLAYLISQDTTALI